MTPVDAGRLPMVPEQSGQRSELQASQMDALSMMVSERQQASRAEGPLLSTVSTQARQESLADRLSEPISQPDH